jgi:hypothetical protein
MHLFVHHAAASISFSVESGTKHHVSFAGIDYLHNKVHLSICHIQYAVVTQANIMAS